VPQGRSRNGNGDQSQFRFCRRFGCSQIVRQVSPSQAARGQGRYCSKSCAKLDRWKRLREMAEKEGSGLTREFIEERGEGAQSVVNGGAPGSHTASKEESPNG